jgi:hypothetical protein
MRLPDTIALNPVFLGVRHEGRERIAGTGFFFTIRSEPDPNTNFGYLVTARHCVEQAQRLGPMFVRINRRTPGPPIRGLPHAEVIARVADAEVIDLDGAQWIFHDDEANDVAVLPFMPTADDHLFVAVERESLATADVLANEAIGIGDDLVVVGLFSSHHGRTINRPIVRSGIIAAMPEEPLEDPNSGLPYDAYLAEVRSIGGLSGSPVWAIINPARVRPNSTTPERRLHFYLLGLIRGHWRKDDEWLADVAETETDSLNTGIAIVTPIEKAIDIIDSEDLIRERRRVEREEIAPNL